MVKEFFVNIEATTNQTGWVLYDGSCPICTSSARRFEQVLRRAGFALATLQSKNAGQTELLVRLPDGRTFGGADGFVQIARQIWWLWPLWLSSRLPGAMPLFRGGYRFVAKHRYCANGACAVPGRTNAFNWVPLILLPAATLLWREALPAWVFMWLFVTAMFAGCKWLTWRRVANRSIGPLSVGYLFAWPGMDANQFLTRRHGRKPKPGEWMLAAGRFLAGLALVWMAARNSLVNQPVVNAWLAMFGLTLILHFGLFHLVALAWQRAGVSARPLMQSPLLATSLADFWSARWNTAFNKLVHDLAFRPLARRTGIACATMAVFLISGVIHELSISLPARGGYGLPFAYFTVQGLGVLFERSKAGRALGLGRGARGWLFTLIVTATPAYWLFHPTFVQNVILPMLQFIGAN